MKNENYIVFVRITALLSFTIGTLIFLLYKNNHAFYWMEVGAAYISVAFIINCIVLLVALIQAAVYYREGPKLFLNSLLMLLNIPMVFIYIALI